MRPSLSFSPLTWIFSLIFEDQPNLDLLSQVISLKLSKPAIGGVERSGERERELAQPFWLHEQPPPSFSLLVRSALFSLSNWPNYTELNDFGERFGGPISLFELTGPQKEGSTREKREGGRAGAGFN